MADQFNLSDTTPAAPAGRNNVQWQSDASGNVSGNVAMVRGASVSRSTTLSIPNNADTGVQFTTEDQDDDNFFTSGSNTRLTAPRDGWYTVSAYADWASSASGVRYGAIRKNGTAFLGSSHDEAGSDRRHNVTLIVYLLLGDYLEWMMYQNSGGGLNIEGATFAILGYR